jgi:hypothetical protein
VQKFVYAALSLAMACGFLFYYFTKRQPGLHKKWWVLLCAFALLALGGNEVYKGVHQNAEQRVPPKDQLENTLSASDPVASSELLYNSPDGYQIIIPKGLTYTKPKSAASLIATNKNDPGNSLTLVVMKQSSAQDLDSIVKELVMMGKKAKPPKTYVFQEKNKSADQRRGYIEASNNGATLKAAILLTRHENSIYRVVISAPKTYFEREKAEIEKVLQSFKVL